MTIREESLKELIKWEGTLLKDFYTEAEKNKGTPLDELDRRFLKLVLIDRMSAVSNSIGIHLQ